MLEALLAALALSAATPVAPLPAPEPETLDAGYDQALRLTLPARVNGQGPYHFTVDTGADRSVVSDTLAAELKLPSAGPATVFGIGGAQAVPTVTLDRLKFGRREHRGIRAPVLARGSLGAPGFLGIDALAKESILLDFRTRQVHIARSKQDAMIDEPGVIVVTGKSRFGQLILTDARIGKVKVYAVIDTGAQDSIGNLALRRLLGREGPLDDRGGRVLGVTGTSLPAEAATIRSIKLGGMTVNNMAVSYADLATFHRFGLGDQPAILLGMDVLRGFERVAIDFAHRSVRFKILGDGPLRMGEATSRKGTPTALGL